MRNYDMTRGTETTDNPWQREEKEANAFLVSMSGFSSLCHPAAFRSFDSGLRPPIRMTRTADASTDARHDKVRTLGMTWKAGVPPNARNDKGIRR